MEVTSATLADRLQRSQQAAVKEFDDITEGTAVVAASATRNLAFAN